MAQARVGESPPFLPKLLLVPQAGAVLNRACGLSLAEVSGSFHQLYSKPAVMTRRLRCEGVGGRHVLGGRRGSGCFSWEVVHVIMVRESGCSWLTLSSVKWGQWQLGAHMDITKCFLALGLTAIVLGTHDWVLCQEESVFPAGARITAWS